MGDSPVRKVRRASTDHRTRTSGPDRTVAPSPRRTLGPLYSSNMRVAVLHVEIHIPYAQSLKDKRMVLRRLKDRLQKFNVAVAELEHQDLWQRASLGIVAISNTTVHVEQELAAAAEEIERLEPGLISRSEIEYLT